MDITIENGKTSIIAIDFNAKLLLHTKNIPTAHSPIPTAHFVSKNTILGPGVIIGCFVP